MSKRNPLIRAFLLAALTAVLQAGASAPSAIVRGRIVLPDGRPAVGARVEAYSRLSQAEDAPLLDQREARRPAAFSTASKDGTFSLRLSAGSFTVAVSAEGLARVELDEELLAGEDDALPAIVLAPGSSVSGRIVDPAGRPVDGAVVAVSGEENDEGIRESTRAHTGKDGRFKTTDASGDPIEVLVRSPGHPPLSKRIDSLPSDAEGLVVKMRNGARLAGTVRGADGSVAADAIVSASGHAVRSASDGRWSLDGVEAGRIFVGAFKGDLAGSLTLFGRDSAQSRADLMLAPSAAIEGTIIDAKTRRPLSGVLLVAGPVSAATDRNGAYLLTGLAPALVTLEANKRGYVPAPVREVRLAAGARARVALALVPAARFSGKIVGDEGKPVAGARVWVDREGIRQFVRRARGTPAVGPSARTDAAGAFTIFTEGGGAAVALVARARDFAAGSLGGLRAAPGETKTGILIRLTRGVAAAGVVVREDGTGVPDMRVTISPESETLGRGARFAARFSTSADSTAPRSKTDSQGRFRLDHLRPGPSSVTVDGNPFAKQVVRAVVIKKSGVTEIAKIVLRPAAAIEGMVSDSAGHGIVGAAIAGNSETHNEETETDPSGHFRLAGFSPGERVFVRAEAADHAPARRDVQAPATGVSFTLSSDGTLVGRVTDAATGGPIPVFSIGRNRAAGPGRFAGGPNGAGSASELHSSDGNFELPDVPPGAWTFTASAPGHQTQTLSGIEIPEGGKTDTIEFELKAGLSLSGLVVDANSGMPVPDATVQGFPPGSAQNPFARLGLSGGGPSAVTDAQGAFRLEDLPPGPLVVTAQDDTHVPAQANVDPATQKEIVLKLTGGGSLSGNVVSSDGRTPAAGAVVNLTAEGNPEMAFLLGALNSTAADSGGGFFFDHLAAGRYALRASLSAASSEAVETVLNPGQAQTGLVITLQGGVHVSGHVTGLPASDLSSVQVAASGSNGFVHSTAADPTGAYAIEGVPAGPLRLVARVTSSARKSASTSVEVPDGQTEMTADIAFSGDGSLSGRVTRGGTGLPSERVIASPSPGSAATSSASGQTDAGGSYRIAGLDSGDYDVRVQGQGGSARRAVSISGDTALDIDLPVISVSGSIFEAGSNEPVEGVNVSLDSGNEPNAFSLKRATTDSLGKFQISDVDAADYQLSAQKQGWQTSTQSLAVTDVIAGLSIALTRAQGITLVVTDGMTGLPLGGYHATVFSTGGAIAFDGSLSADSTGRSEIPQLAPDVYSFYVFAGGYATLIAPQVSIPCPPLSLALTPGGTLVVRVDPSATGVAALLQTAGGLPYLRSSFNLTGVFRLQPTALPHMAPGGYTLNVQLPDGARSYTVQISEGQQTIVAVP